MKHDLVLLSDEIWQRTSRRLTGLTDAEYLWEPAPGCWTIRRCADGVWREDWPLPRPDPEPFTTIAWRLWHLIDMYGEDRAPTWLGVPAQGAAIGRDDPSCGAPPPTAADARSLLVRAHERWDAHLALSTDESLQEVVGPVGGAYADRTRAKYVLHMLDEFIHHGAEIALLRDLWRWQHPLGVEPAVEQAMRGDRAVLEAVDGLEPAQAAEVVRAAAAYARWDLLAALLRAGAPIPTDGTTPLHVAAAAGRLGEVQLLVERGADLAARDPEYRATPLVWARFVGEDAVAEWLEAQEGGTGRG